VAQGLANTRVASITLSYIDTSGARKRVPVRVFRLTHHVARRIGVKSTLHLFLAFVPRGLFPVPSGRHHPTLREATIKRAFSRMRFTTYDAGGDVIRTRDLGGRRWWRGVVFEPPAGYASGIPGPSSRN
jgi:hypothetical protein